MLGKENYIGVRDVLVGELLLVDGVGRRTLADVLRMFRWENSDM